jgi:hypothetical protein
VLEFALGQKDVVFGVVIDVPYNAHHSERLYHLDINITHVSRAFLFESIKVTDLLDLVDDWIESLAESVSPLVRVWLKLYQALTLDLYVNQPCFLIWMEYKPVTH